MKDNYLKLLKDQILDYQRYEQRQIKIIGYNGHKHSDCVINDIMSYTEWISTYYIYPVIKIEGIESIQEIRQQYSNCINIHLFINQQYGFSFNWHRDTVNVRLHVLRGKKYVWIRNKKYILHSTQSVIIAKGYLHRVCSQQDTWALSVGY